MPTRDQVDINGIKATKEERGPAKKRPTLPKTAIVNATTAELTKSMAVRDYVPNGKMFVGRLIVEVRPITKEELKAEGWEGHRGETMVLVLEGGAKIYAACDHEGNGPGVLIGQFAGGTQVQVLAES